MDLWQDGTAGTGGKPKVLNLTQERLMNEQDLRQNPEVDAARQKYGFGISWLVLMVALPPLVYYLWICVTY